MHTARGMRLVTSGLLSAALLAGGCVNVKVPEKIDVNFNGGGNRGGGSPNGGSTSDNNDQLPDSSSTGDTQSSEVSPRPQSASSGNGGWKDMLIGAAEGFGAMATAMEHGVLFYALDTLAYPEEEVDLTARLQGKRLSGLPGAQLGFYRGEELIGKATTNADGYAKVTWTPPKAGDYAFEVKVLSPPPDDESAQEATKVSPAPLLVAARDKDTQFTVIDLDHTVVDSGFLWVLLGGADPMRGAADAVQRLEQRYSLIYLTHRPDILTRKSKLWLSEHGFPRAPLLVSGLTDVFGDSGKFKTAKLRALRESFPNVRVGIGDKLSDAQAYVDNGLTAYLIPHYKREPEDMNKMARQIEALRGRGRLHVVDGWSEIESGVFQGKSYPPGRFARRLRVEARDLRIRQMREDDDDEDDDDDDD